MKKDIAATIESLLTQLKAKMGAAPAWSADLKAQIPAVNPAYRWPKDTVAILDDIIMGNPIGLVGHTGCGKSSLVKQIAARIGWPVIRINLSQQTNTSDFLGLWVVKDGQMEWIDGRLPAARRSGAWLLIDEYDAGEPMILQLMHPVLEHDEATGELLGELCLKEKNGEIVHAHPAHRMFMTGNTLGQFSEYRHLYTGTQINNCANVNRFPLYIIDYLSVEDEAQMLSVVANVPLNAATHVAEVAAMIRKQFIEGTLRSPLSTRQVIAYTKKVVRMVPHMELREAVEMAAKCTVLNKCEKSDADAIWELFKRKFLDEGV